ncbi:mechanosensitive ion channel domain-containing protein [Humibacter ginsenosidimutans]|uniref:Mechanosensitive ion channel n=1 Tax=Humibacter ginsenosidimutans TaxID=2599293 RepID=A0A5B8M2S5_9MICO|nr:mechanosensitive ion channel domain-containing protein [Humibacter ginsenosidimutans]QDZ14032.1 mechanosensitive ion channel [Humibacter ginsenosidimutans]
MIFTSLLPTANAADPSFWHTILEGLIAIGWKLVWCAVIIVVSFFVAWLLRLIIRRIVRQIVSGVKNKQNVADTQALTASPIAAVRVVQRTRTLGTVLSNIVNVVIAIIAIILCVNAINKDILGSFALLTAALGAGLGFGAQNIVKDVLNGLFMVMEDQLGVGDVVDLGPATGVVEVVGIRVTQIRDVNGTLWFVRNGEILRVGNMSQGWARVITDLAVPYDSDVDAIEERMLKVATELATTPRWRSRIVEKPEIWGIESVSSDAIVLRVVLKTRTTAKDDVARELRKRLKASLDEMGVTLPSLSSVVLTGFDGAASITGAHPPRTRPNPVVTTQDPKAKRKRAKRTTTSTEPAAPSTARHPQAITKPLPNTGTTPGAAPRNPSPGEHGLQSDHHEGQQ